MKHSFIIALALAALTACGGGGGGNPPTVENTPKPLNEIAYIRMTEANTSFGIRPSTLGQPRPFADSKLPRRGGFPEGIEATWEGGLSGRRVERGPTPKSPLVVRDVSGRSRVTYDNGDIDIELTDIVFASGDDASPDLSYRLITGYAVNDTIHMANGSNTAWVRFHGPRNDHAIGVFHWDFGLEDFIEGGFGAERQ